MADGDLFSDADLGIETAALTPPAATPAAPKLMSDADLGIGDVAAPAAAPGPWGRWAEHAVSGVPSAIGHEFSSGLEAYRAGFGPERRPGTEGTFEGMAKTGSGLAGIAQMAGAIPVGAAKSLLGHPMAAAEHAAGTLINPEVAAKDDPQAMYETAAGDVGTALAGVMPRGPWMSRAPVLPETPMLPPPRIAPMAPMEGGEVVPPYRPTPPPTPEPFVQTPREGLDIRLLPPEAPHAAPPPPEAGGARRSMGAAGTSGPLAEVGKPTIAKLKEILTEEGFTPHTLEQRLEEMSQHEFLGELSDNTRQLMTGLQTKPGPAVNEIRTVVRQRGREAPDRMRSTFDQAFGPYENREQLRRIMEIERNKETLPFWQAFRETQVPPSPAITALLPRLDAAGALRAANKALAEEGLPSEVGFRRLGAGYLQEDPNILPPMGPRPGQEVPPQYQPVQVEQVPTASAFQYAKEHLDDLIESNISRPGGENAARRYTGLKNALVDAIDHHPDPNVAGTWRAARDAYATPTSVMKAMKLGERVLTGNISAEELPFLTASYSPAELRAFNIGMRGRLEDIAGRPGRTENTVINTILARSNQDKIRWAIGDEKANALIGAIEHEQRMHHAPNQLIYNSATAGRLKASDFWEPPAGVLGNVSLGDVAHGLRHPVQSALKAGAKFGMAKRAAKETAKYDQIRDEAARIFTLQGPERDAVVRELIGTMEEPNPSGSADNMAKKARAPRSPSEEETDERRVKRASGGRVSVNNIESNPTEAQKRAGNYAKDHINIHGLDITIENAKGSTRSGYDKDGKKWNVVMPCAYGYIRRAPRS